MTNPPGQAPSRQSHRRARSRASAPFRPVAGVDGCKAGWLCVYETQHGLSAIVASDIIELVSALPARTLIGIDIPIGLPDTGDRASDAAARSLLGKRGSSVFPAPLRATVAHSTTRSTWEQLNRFQTRHADRGLSRQTAAILPRIREVDAFLRRHPRHAQRIVEVHPEVSFCFWNGQRPMADRKKSKEGRAARRKLIDEHWARERAWLLDVLRATVRSQFAEDDLNDAFAALWTMHRYRADCHETLPESGARDSIGLPMQIIV